jgi:hypothetical protein
MALTVTFTLNGNKVAVAETGDVTRNYSLKPEYNVFPHPSKTDRVIITNNANPAGNDSDTYEYRIGDIAGAPVSDPLVLPAEQNATVTYLTTNFFKGYTIADLAVDTVNVDIARNTWETIKNESNDAVFTASYYSGAPAGNPSGNTNNMETLIISSAALATSATKTFTWDASDNLLTITYS